MTDKIVIPPFLDALRRASRMSEENFERRAADVLNRAFASTRKWSDGGGTGLVQWTGDMGPGMDVEIPKAKEQE